MNKNLFAGVACLAIGLTASAQKLDKFGADLAKKSVMGKEIRVPYTDLTSYYGYIKPGAAPDEVKGGKKMYYVYVWIPIAAPEIGVRMISPVPDSMKPGDGDYQTADYKSNANDVTNFFDTWITLERAEGILKIEDAKNAKTAKWISIDKNDDSSEMPANPKGNKYNSLMRITSNPSDPSKSLVMGLYRIGFTTYKTGEVQGSFLAQIGAPVKLPGVAIAAKPEDLAASVRK